MTEENAAQRSHDWPSLLLLGGTVAQLARALYFLLTVFPRNTAYSNRMLIDGNLYLTSARQMIETGSWFFTPETYHSVGMQLTTAAIARLFGPSPLNVKLFNFICFCASLPLVHAIGLKLGFSKRRALLACLLAASSVSLQRYCATVQYEVPTMTIILAVVFCALEGRAIAFGVLASILLVFRVHFLFPLIPLVTLLTWTHGRPAATRAAISFATITVPIYLAYAIHFDQWTGFQRFVSSENWLCLGAPGSNYPYFDRTANPPCGWEFIAREPLEYLALVGRRFLFWIGWSVDSWTILPISWTFRRIVIIVFGCSVALAALGKRNARASTALAFAILFSFIPFFIAGSSNRFLVPFIPLIVLTTLSVKLSGTARIRGPSTATTN